jgi:hypothetical protein
MNTILAKIKEIAAQNPDGFTILLPTLEHAKRGWVVALAETQDSFGDEGLEKVLQIAQLKQTAIGGWEHKGKLYWDAVLLIPDRETAERLGRENKQIGIFNIEAALYLEL